MSPRDGLIVSERVAPPGLEPGSPCGGWILSPLRLPVSPEGPALLHSSYKDLPERLVEERQRDYNYPQ